MQQVQLHQGDCLEVLQTLSDNSVDSVVCDPPYELGFMGKSWDATGIAYSVDLWKECLRVLKPGGHLLAFSGSRTYHRMTCAIEDAGFEIRDQIMWVYGSGFPKSLDVSKAIDKLDASDARRARQLRFTEWVRGTGLTAARIDEITGTQMGGHYTAASSQPSVATREHLEQLRPHFNQEVPAWVEEMVNERTVESENFKRRQVVGQLQGTTLAVAPGQGTDRDTTTLDITAPATEAARQWEGWGTALKPAHEPICMARKPFKGTVAGNVLEHGTGALNIDGCRVAATDGVPKFNSRGESLTASMGAGLNGSNRTGEMSTAGRWPANLIHDGSEEVVGLFPDKAGAAAPVQGSEESLASTGSVTGKRARVPGAFHGDTGSAARFFYCAKASKKDRDEGLEGFERKPCGLMEDDNYEIKTGSGNVRDTRRANVHPTVKPTDLMRYLVRLVTPPGGLVLDPFMGSGSTGKAAVLEGFAFVGIEREPEYLEIARARIEHVRLPLATGSHGHDAQVPAAGGAT